MPTLPLEGVISFLLEIKETPRFILLQEKKRTGLWGGIWPTWMPYHTMRQVDSAYLWLKKGMKCISLPLTCILSAPHDGTRPSLNSLGSQCNETLRSSNSSAEKEKTENVKTTRVTWESRYHSKLVSNFCKSSAEHPTNTFWWSLPHGGTPLS